MYCEIWDEHRNIEPLLSSDSMLLNLSSRGIYWFLFFIKMCHTLVILQIWIFDQPDGGGHLLRQRSGHSDPPNRIHHHGPTGENILSAGECVS